MLESGNLDQLSKAYLKDEELLKSHFKKSISEIERVNAELNAFVSIDKTNLEQQLHGLTNLSIEDRSRKPLYGISISVKDNICTKDSTTTAGSKILEGFVAQYDATAVKRCRDAGALIVGKTNCDEFAMGSSTETSVYGVTKNPWDHTRVAGGTSGGAAAAVASSLCDVSLGSDTGGSVRQPAAFCGVVGFKPSYGAVSRYGLIAHGSSLDQIGILSKRVSQTRSVFNVINGKDIMDPTSLDIDDWERTSKERLRPRIGLLEFDQGCDPDVKNSLRNYAQVLKADGCHIESISMKALSIAVPLYYILSTAEAASNLSRYDGIRFGRRVEMSEGKESLQKFRSENFGSEVKRRILLGTFVLSEGYFDKYYAKAMKIRKELQYDIKQIFSKFDLILTPTTPTTAFKIGEKSSDPVSMYLSDIFTTVANLAGIPAISLPVGLDSNGLPIGMQLMAAKGKDRFLLNIAEQFEALTPTSHMRPAKNV
jgi:aspartyl-tRNA(Asn)/glutamyl-tRNA(Gln) amidotransferase subunit A